MNLDSELEEMADDPDIQREIREIEMDFRITELDGLEKFSNEAKLFCPEL